jgi:hypothetical protein
MTSPSPHRFHRHPAAPWAELRDSARSPHCFRLHMHAEDAQVASAGIAALGL